MKSGYVKAFLLALMMCLVAMPIARYIAPQTVVDGGTVYLAWLPLSVTLAILLLFGRHAIAPLIIGSAIINEIFFHLPFGEAAVLLFCQLFAVLLVCAIVRWQLGSRWRYGIPNKNMGVRILWMGFIAPIGIKISMYIAGAWLNYPIYLSNYFGSGSVIFSIIDIQSLMCAALIFTMIVYYPMRMILNPRFAKVWWRRSVAPCFSKKNVYSPSAGWRH